MENGSNGSEGRGRQRRQAKQNAVTRRAFVRAVIPGTGIVDVVKAKGDISDFTVAQKVGVIEDAALIAVAVGGGAVLLSGEHKDTRPLKEVIKSFTWNDLKNPEKRNAFVNRLADEYLRSTKSSRVNKEDLTGDGKITFYAKRDQYLKALTEVNPGYVPPDTQWGYTHYASKKVFIDLENMEKQGRPKGDAGFALIDVLWHEWGHLDVSDRTEGEFLHNPANFFQSPFSGKNEEFQKYRGGAIYTDTYYGYLRFDEVWNDTITVRRILDELKLDSEDRVLAAGDYYQNGVDFFRLLTPAIGITTEELYQKHATSDFEGLAKRIGEKLPGEGTPVDKGVGLFLAIHRNDRAAIEKSGALSLLPRSK